MDRLSEAGEQKLLRSLIETITKQCEIATYAYQEGNMEEIRKVGHLLKGNSGALYFNLDQIMEIGRCLEKSQTISAKEFTEKIHILREWAKKLENYRR